MWHCRKCSHSGVVSGTMYGQLLAGQFLSPKTVKQSSLRIDRDDLVPSRPCSSATSQNLIYAFSLAMLSANCRDEWFSYLSRVLILSALTTRSFSSLSDQSAWLTENFTGKLGAKFDWKLGLLDQAHIDVTSDAAMELKTWELRGAFWLWRTLVVYKRELAA